MKRLFLAVAQLLSTLAVSTTASAACTNQSISVGETKNGSLNTDDCVTTGGYYYDGQFTGASGQQLYILNSSSVFDVDLMLIYPDDTYLYDDDSGGGTNARIPASGYLTLPASGLYTIAASSAAPLKAGAYTLTLAGATTPPATTGASVIELPASNANREKKIMNRFVAVRRQAQALIAALALSVSPMAMSFTVDTNGSAITGLWYNAAESGWGVNVVQQYDIMFVTMFVYDNAGNPTWYVASNCAVSGSGCSGTLYAVTGGQLPTATWNGPVSATSVGSVTLAFTDANTGIMNYTINGASGSKAITRQVWRTSAPATTTCSNGATNYPTCTLPTSSDPLAVYSGSYTCTNSKYSGSSTVSATITSSLATVDVSNLPDFPISTMSVPYSSSFSSVLGRAYLSNGFPVQAVTLVLFASSYSIGIGYTANSSASLISWSCKKN